MKCDLTLPEGNRLNLIIIYLLTLVSILTAPQAQATGQHPFIFGVYESSDEASHPLCPQGNLQIVGTGKEAVLIFGPNIFFPNPFGGIEVDRPEKKGCEYRIETKLVKNTLTKITTISKCPEKKFNNKITESLTQTSPEQLEYEIKSKDENGDVNVKCVSQIAKEN